MLEEGNGSRDVAQVRAQVDALRLLATDGDRNSKITSQAAWKLLGNKLFGAIATASTVDRPKLYEDCLYCYDHAVRFDEARANNLSLLYSNIAVCAHKLHLPLNCFKYANVASALNPSNEKAEYWRRQGEANFRKGGGDFSLAYSKPDWERYKAITSAGKTQDVTDASVDWSALKAEGAAAFKQGDFETAIAKYLSSVETLGGESLKDIAVLFCNRSEASKSAAGEKHENTHMEAALHDSEVASVLDPTNAKAWVRKSRALCSLGDLAAGKRVLSENKSLPLVRLEIAEAEKREKKRRELVKPISEVPTAAQHEMHEAELRKLEGSSRMNGDETVFLHNRLSMLPEEMRVEMFGPLCLRQPPDLARGFSLNTAAKWPPGLAADLKAFAFQKLKDGTLVAKSHPWMKGCSIRGKLGTGASAFSEFDVMKRYHGNAPLMKYIRNQPNLKHGDILDWQGKVGVKAPYVWMVRSMYSNVPAPPGPTSNCPIASYSCDGSEGTHVSVGFNDLDELFRAKLTAHLRYIGVDVSPYSVAKSQVILQLLRSEAVSVAAVLQVWYSAAWSTSTLKAFRSAAAFVARELAEDTQSDTDMLVKADHRVLSYINLWALCEPLPLEEARRRWLALQCPNDEGRTRSLGFLCNLKRACDRDAGIRYMLTGDVGFDYLPAVDRHAADAGPAVGSVCMWNVPSGTPPLEQNQIFQVMNMHDLLKHVEALDHAGKPLQEKTPNATNIIAAWTSLTVMGIKHARNSLVSGLLSVELYLGEVSRNNDALSDYIAMQWAPTTIAWSNVVDYFPTYTEFHRVAGRCSNFAKGTCHFAYSMNWEADVHGCNVMDYPAGSKQAVAIMDKCETGALQESQERDVPYTHYFHMPPFDNPENTCRHWLALQFHRRWVAHFMGKCAVPCRKASLLEAGETCMALMNVLSNSTSSTVWFSWSYALQSTRP